VKWYSIECPQCKWNASMVSEDVANEFRKQQFCWDCLNAKRDPARFVIREYHTNTRGTK